MAPNSRSQHHAMRSTRAQPPPHRFLTAPEEGPEEAPEREEEAPEEAEAKRSPSASAETMRLRVQG